MSTGIRETRDTSLYPIGCQLDTKRVRSRFVRATAPTSDPPPARTRTVLGLEPRFVAIGVAGGILSGLLGVGGGIVMVPLLVIWAAYAQRDAHATSLGAIIPISCASVVTYGVAGKIRVVDAAALAVGAVLGARIGASLLSRVSDRPLKLAFGLFLAAAAVLMVAK